jgi:ribonuclease P protein component
VKRQNRITRTVDFKRVRQDGKTITHSLVSILVLRVSGDNKRVGIIVGKSVGNAVTRNLVKRRIRAVADQFIQKINQGVDILIIAKPSAALANYDEIYQAIARGLQKVE